MRDDVLGSLSDSSDSVKVAPVVGRRDGRGAGVVVGTGRERRTAARVVALFGGHLSAADLALVRRAYGGQHEGL